MSNSLTQGQQLTIGQSIDSPSGRARLVLQQDGNLVLYRTVDNQPVWATNTVGSGAVRATMQFDGNFVLYQSHGVARWASNTAGNNGAHLDLQDDGNLVVYLGAVALWASGTAGSLRDRGPDRLIPPQELDHGGHIDSADHRFTLWMDDSGHVHLTRNRDGARLWAPSGAGNYLKMQSDGNLVLSGDGHHAGWASNTAGHQGAFLVLQNDANLVIYKDNVALWASHTVGENLQQEPLQTSAQPVSDDVGQGVSTSS